MNANVRIIISTVLGTPLYCMFQRKDHKEGRGRKSSRRTLSDREKDYLAFKEEFGYLESDTIVGVRHKSAVVTPV